MMSVQMHCHRTRIEHVDTDAYGVVHFSRYASIAETAVLDCLASNDLSLDQIAAIGLELRVRELRMKYLSSATYRDDIKVIVYRPELTAAVIRFSVAICMSDTETAVTQGKLELVAVRSDDGKPTRLPNHIKQRLGG